MYSHQNRMLAIVSYYDKRRHFNPGVIMSRTLALILHLSLSKSWSTFAFNSFYSPRCDLSTRLRVTAKIYDCVVVGSGISGSSVAHHLTHSHKINSILMTERNDVVGGNVISKSNSEGFVWEEGPNSFQPTSAIVQTIHELNLDNELVLADPSLPRFVYWKGGGAGERLANLHALPTNLPGDLLDFDLLTWPGKIRAGLGALGFVEPPQPADGKEETIREFVVRHLGEEAFLRIIDPFVSGVYAGDPDSLAMRAALKKIHRLEGLGDFGPGLVSGAINRFKELAKEKKEHPPDPSWRKYRSGELGSFKKGLQTLPNTVAETLGAERVKTGWGLEKIEKENGMFKCTYDVSGRKEVVISKSVVLTAPTRVASLVAADLMPAASRYGLLLLGSSTPYPSDYHSVWTHFLLQK